MKKEFMLLSNNIFVKSLQCELYMNLNIFHEKIKTPSFLLRKFLKNVKIVI